METELNEVKRKPYDWGAYKSIMPPYIFSSPAPEYSKLKRDYKCDWVADDFEKVRTPVENKNVEPAALKEIPIDHIASKIKNRFRFGITGIVTKILNNPCVISAFGNNVINISLGDELIFSASNAIRTITLFHVIANYANGIEIPCEYEIVIPESPLGEEFLAKCKEYFKV